MITNYDTPAPMRIEKLGEGKGLDKRGKECMKVRRELFIYMWTAPSQERST